MPYIRGSFVCWSGCELCVGVLAVGERSETLEGEDAAVMEVAEEEADGVATDIHVLDDLDIRRDIVDAGAPDVAELVDAFSAGTVAAHVSVRHEGLKTVRPHDV